MFGKVNPEKRFPFFAVCDATNKNLFYTLTLTKDEALEYVYRLLVMQHSSHFLLWCENQNKDKNSLAVFKEYVNNCVSTEEQNTIIIAKVEYKLRDIVAMMRMFGGCLPIGSSFDTQAEYNRVKSAIDANEQQKKSVGPEAHA